MSTDSAIISADPFMDFLEGLAQSESDETRDTLAPGALTLNKTSQTSNCTGLNIRDSDQASGAAAPKGNTQFHNYVCQHCGEQLFGDDFFALLEDWRIFRRLHFPNSPVSSIFGA